MSVKASLTGSEADVAVEETPKSASHYHWYYYNHYYYYYYIYIM